MQREMLEQQLEAARAEAAALKGRLDAAMGQLCAVATPSNPQLLNILKVKLIQAGLRQISCPAWVF